MSISLQETAGFSPRSFILFFVKPGFCSSHNASLLEDSSFLDVISQPRFSKKGKGFNVQAVEHLQFSHENFLNKKIKVTGSGKYSDREKRIRLGLMKEDIFNTPFFAGFDLADRWESDERYNLKGQGRDIYVGMKVSRKTKLTLKFENQRFLKIMRASVK